MSDFYKLLGVPRNATIVEIKKAYRILALSLHPDITKNDEIKSKRFQLITNAYQKLSNEQEKNIYDSSIGIKRVIIRNNPRAASHSIPKQPLSKSQYNVELWNAWHYGDGKNTIVTSSVKQTNKWSNMKGNKDQSYFNKKAARETQIKYGETNNNNYSSTNPSEILRKTREVRRQKKEKEVINEIKVDSYIKKDSQENNIGGCNIS
jgi:curved DNA-binding protein CbpA